MLNLLCFLMAVPDSAELMRQVGENQDRAQAARAQYVYQLKKSTAMRNKRGRMIWDETRVYTMLPDPQGAKRKLVSVSGHCWHKGRELEFHGHDPKVRDKDCEETIDGWDDEITSNDGVERDWFPLTSKKQSSYTYQVMDDRTVEGRTVYTVHFQPKDHSDYGWTGQALVDAEDLQPVSIYTQLSRRLPVGVRIILGVDLPGLGYSVRYRRLEKDVWFPASFGTEFRVKALHFIDRTIVESGETSNFHRASAESHIEYGPMN